MIYKEGSDKNDYTFAGKEKDESGLFYFVARYYDPTLGRFISRDIIYGDNDNPLSQNRYIYAMNNPLRYIDPTGNSPEDLAKTYNETQNEIDKKTKLLENETLSDKEKGNIQNEINDLEKGNEELASTIREKLDAKATETGKKGDKKVDFDQINVFVNGKLEKASTVIDKLMAGEILLSDTDLKHLDSTMGNFLHEKYGLSKEEISKEGKKRWDWMRVKGNNLSYKEINKKINSIIDALYKKGKINDPEGFRRAVKASLWTESEWSQFNRAAKKNKSLIGTSNLNPNKNKKTGIVKSVDIGIGMANSKTAAKVGWDIKKLASDVNYNLGKTISYFGTKWMHANVEKKTANPFTWNRNRARSSYSAYNTGIDYSRYRKEKDDRDVKFFKYYKSQPWKKKLK